MNRTDLYVILHCGHAATSLGDSHRGRARLGSKTTSRPFWMALHMRQALASTTRSYTADMPRTSKAACKCTAGCSGVPILRSAQGVIGFWASLALAHTHTPVDENVCFH
eukprot:3536576-Amphidinium_carterae.2